METPPFYTITNLYLEAVQIRIIKHFVNNIHKTFFYSENLNKKDRDKTTLKTKMPAG